MASPVSGNQDVSDETLPLCGFIKPNVLPLWKLLYRDYDPLLFIKVLSGYLKPTDEVLEVGAGSGTIYPHSVRSKVKRLVGLDPDDRVISNQQLDEGLVGVCESMPFPNASFDIVFHRMVAEHFEDPLAATAEIARVLKPKGLLLMHTPNRFYYPMIAARLTPLWFHQRYMQAIATRKGKDVHEVYYRMNSANDIRTICKRSSLQIRELRFITSPPGYLRFSPLAFLAGALYEKTAERMFPKLRPGIILVAAKASA